MLGVLINIGSSSQDPDGRAKLSTNFRFNYMPIPETAETREKVPTYRKLGFDNVRFPDLQVHLDPEFETYTYGHVRRGFGDISRLLEIKNGGILFFFATFEDAQSGLWIPCIIGYFDVKSIFDCRGLTIDQILELKSKDFSNNAHFKRVDPSVDLLVKGHSTSKLLKKAFPLANFGKPTEVKVSLSKLISTSTGMPIKSGSPWFRWTLTSKYPHELLGKIDRWQK